MPEVLEDIAMRLDAIEGTLGARIDRVDTVVDELRQAADAGFGRLERRLIQLAQVLVAKQSSRGREK